MLAWRALMSQYVFFCEDCKKEFTLHLHMSDREQGSERGSVPCPHCQSTNVHQLVTAFSAVTSKKS